MRKQAFLFLSLLLATGLLFASCASQTTRKGSSANSSSPANAEHTETQTSVSGGGTPSGGRNHGRDMPLRHRQDSGRYGRKHGHGNNMAENRSDDQNGANSRPAEHRKRGLLD